MQRRRTDLQRVRRLSRYLSCDQKRLYLTLVLLIPTTCAGVVQPLLVGQAISTLRGEPNLPGLAGLPTGDALRWIVAALLCSVLVRLALQGFQSFNIQLIGQRLTARIRNDLFKHSLSLSLRFHDHMPVGKLLTRLTSDVDALAEVFGSGAVGILADIVFLLIVVITMLLIEWRLGLLLLLVEVPVAFTILALQRRYRSANYCVREQLSRLNADFQENLQGLEVVQMFRRESVNGARFRSTGETYRRAINGTIFFDSSISALLEWVSLVAVALILAVGGWMVSNVVINLGTLTTFVLFSQRLFDPLRQIAERSTQIQGGLTAVERISEFFEEPLEIIDRAVLRETHAQYIAGAGEVIFEDVSFAYRPGESILQNLSFRIAPGEHVALVGPTGSGKSTVIRLLCRLYEPQAGQIILDGCDIRDLPMQELRRRLGVILQDTFLFSGNIADNLRLDTAISNQRLKEICCELGLNSLLDRLPCGLNTELRERGGNLSSGERQLLAIARVAIRKPSVLVMDEATAFMDPSTEATLQRDLDRFFKQRTAIIIAHRLATVETADRILVLQKGRLIEEGNHIQLRSRGGLYAQLAALQEQGLAAF